MKWSAYHICSPFFCYIIIESVYRTLAFILTLSHTKIPILKLIKIPWISNLIPVLRTTFKDHKEALLSVKKAKFVCQDLELKFGFPGTSDDYFLGEKL